MNEPSKIAAIFNKWLSDNAPRISDRFTSERVNDWSQPGGLALDLWNACVHGRVTAWPQESAIANWPFADAEIVASESEQTVFAENFVEFNTGLLDRWLSALEAHSNSN